MKKATLILKDGAIIEVEYSDAIIEHIMWSLENRRLVNFKQKTIACEAIEMIEWID